jgi:polar amino acid transport system substrate-binding protein
VPGQTLPGTAGQFLLQGIPGACMQTRFARHAAVMFVFAVAGACAGTGGSTRSPHPIVATVAQSQLVSAGKLTVCSDLRRPPEDVVLNGQPAGSDIAIAGDLGERLGLSVEIKNIDRATIASAVIAGRCDVALSALEIGEPDAAGLVMTPYYELGEALVVAKTNPHSIAGIADLCGRNVAVLSGSNEEAAALATGLYADKGAFAECSAEGKTAALVHSYKSDGDAATNVISGKEDAFFLDSALGGHELTQTHDLILIDRVTATVVVQGIGTSPSKTSLHDALAKALAAMQADGFLNDIWYHNGVPAPTSSVFSTP